MSRRNLFEHHKRIEKFLEKMKKAQRQEKLDLSSDEDLSLAVMNLISIEEHMFFTAVKTGKLKYLDLLDEVRQIRKKLLKKLIKKYEGEVWCISKHLLAATMRLNEVGTKMLNQGKKKQAWELFQMSYHLYTLFWGLNLGVIKSKELKADLRKMGFGEKEFVDSQEIAQQEDKTLFSKLGELVKKAIDCCLE